MLDKLILKDSLEFNGTKSELKELIRIKRDRGFRLEWIDDSTFKFISESSLGTLIVNYFPVEGIKGFAKMTELENGKTIVEMWTKIRIELYFFLVNSIILIAIGLFSNESWPAWTFALFPLGLLWFWWVYRIQEKGLFKKLRIYLKEYNNNVQN
ncbi:hypothetical protein [Robertkochia aurantiaca]|uniref:hypothetical protein n=1 Tax=Robertkochia aurantiaca TaxID=2873700 RepID=UPI001CC9837F|nr:hypothetical protein [Robertkochia sp. 3YJGBD-33]